MNYPELEAVKALTGGEIRISRRGVPHIVVGPVSVCWFGRTGMYRVFWPYGYYRPRSMEKQEKMDANVPMEAAKAVKHFQAKAIPEPVAPEPYWPLAAGFDDRRPRG